MTTLDLTSYGQLMAALGLGERPQQATLYDKLLDVAQSPSGHVFVQAGTGTGKSYATLGVAATVGKPGAPAIILTVTNALTEQYTLKDAPAISAATGMTFTRVIGSKHYVCASSSAARDAGVPSAEDLPDMGSLLEALDPAEREEARGAVERAKERIRAEREEWLATQTSGYRSRATQYERQSHHGDAHRCPGKTCDGSLLGGCGKRKARERATKVDVVITNFHCATFQTLYANAKILPPPAMVLVDEAHSLPDAVADTLATEVGPKCGSKALAKFPKLVKHISDLREEMIRGIRWDHREKTRAVRLREGDATVLSHALRDAEEKLAQIAVEIDSDAGDEEIGSVDSLRKLIAITLDPEGDDARSLVATVYRYEDEDHKPDTVYLETVDAPGLVRSILRGKAALISGTIPSGLPRRVGLPNSQPSDVGHPFDYANSVRGWISSHEGIKAARRHESPELHEYRTASRLAELKAFIRDGRTLVLCTAHNDVDLLVQRLVPELQLQGLTVYVQPRKGGSPAARVVADAFKSHTGPGGAVLIGTDSLATGLDIPGPALSRVALWSLPLGQMSPVDEVRLRRDRRYRDDRMRTKVSQSIGRLLRHVDDTGEVLLCDSRFVTKWLPGATGLLDSHLTEIPWTVLSPAWYSGQVA